MRKNSEGDEVSCEGLAPVELIVTIPHKTNDEGQDNGNK